MHTRLSSHSTFAGLALQPADPLLKVIAQCASDHRPEKIDLGVGVFRDENGETPVMEAVKEAEHWLARTQPTKAYLGAAGNIPFIRLLEPVVFGSATFRDRLTGLQTPGGTGALRLAAGLVRLGNANATVWVGAPTWPNHIPVFEAEGLALKCHRFYDQMEQRLLFTDMLEDLSAAKAGDVIVLQGGCHNPTGAELELGQWQQLAQVLAERGITPVIDLAYHGLGRDLEADRASTLILFDAVPNAILAYSCDKNFGLYRERVGAIWVKGDDQRQMDTIQSNLLQLSRAAWSMPPDHGAAVVETILSDPRLETLWRTELAAQQQRIHSMRQSLSACHARLAPMALQQGMFSLLPLSTDCVERMMAEDAVYMVGNGRVNIAGLKPDHLPRLKDVFARYL